MLWACAGTDHAHLLLLGDLQQFRDHLHGMPFNPVSSVQGYPYAWAQMQDHAATKGRSKELPITAAAIQQPAILSDGIRLSSTSGEENTAVEASNTGPILGLLLSSEVWHHARFMAS